MPITDVFVATFSIAVMYVVGIGTPTLVVDSYSPGYDIYDNLPGVRIVWDREELKNTLHALRGHTGGSREASDGDSRQWILFDGKCTDRVVGELYRLAEAVKHE